MSMRCGHKAPILTPCKALHIILLFTAALAPAQSSAQLLDRSVPLENLERLTPQAIVDALEAANPDLQALAAAADAATQRVVPAGALDDPMLSYTVAPNTIGSNSSVRQMSQLSQPLPWPGKRELRRSVAAHRAQSIAHQFDATRLQLLAIGQNSYAEWYYIHRAIDINAATIVLVAEITRVAESRYAAGLALQQDVLQAELESVLLQERELALERERSALRARMNALLGRDPTERLPPPGELVVSDALPDLQTLRTSVEVNHPDIRRFEAQIALAHSQVDLANKAFLPDFSANLGYGNFEPREKRLQVGLSINVPLYREKRRADLSAARADLRGGEFELTAARLDILAALESAYTNTHYAIDVVQLYESRLLELADSNLDAALTNYRSGAGEFLSVVTAQRQVLETEQRYERARADYWRMRAELDRASGGVLSAGANVSTVYSRALATTR